MREVPAASCARYNITNLSSAVFTTAGLKVPADSQPAPCGETIGVSEARRHAPNGKFAAGAAKTSDAAQSDSVRNTLCLRTRILANSLLHRIAWFRGCDRRLGALRFLECHRSYNARAFFHHDHLIRLHVLQRINRAARPAYFEQLNLLRFSDAEVHAQIIL